MDKREVSQWQLMQQRFSRQGWLSRYPDRVSFAQKVEQVFIMLVRNAEDIQIDPSQTSRQKVPEVKDTG